MEFSIPAAIQSKLDTIREFVAEEVMPLESQFQKTSFREIVPALEEKRAMVKNLGLWAPHIPQDYGGVGLSLMEFAHVSEELGRSPFGHYVFNAQAPDVGNMEILMHYGTPEQKERFLTPLIAGDIRSCFSMTEPEFAGSNPTRMATLAEKDGDDYVINGHKWFTTSAQGAEFAVVMAITNPGADKYRRASQIIVPTGTPGFKLAANIPVMGEAGEEWLSHGEIVYEDCRVPQANLLGPEGDGFTIAQERLGPGRIHHCMRWIGICERAFDLMCTYAKSRRLTDDKTLGEFQSVQNWIAESRAEINASRLMVLQTAWKIDRDGAKAARDEISVIKFYVAGVLQKVLDRALQTHGGLGMTDYTPLAWWYRHERASRIYDGPDEVHKMSVARRILSRY